MWHKGSSRHDPIDAHEANPAEQTLQVLRQQTCILVKQAEVGGLQAQASAAQAQAGSAQAQAGSAQAQVSSAQAGSGAHEGSAPGPNEADSIFGVNHPIWSWSLLHAGWLRNRFNVENGQTAYERATGMTYGGKIAMFGERVMGFIKAGGAGKAAPSGKWTEGIWLGKTMLNDVHIVWAAGSPSGIFGTRSNQPWDIKLLSSLDVYAWEHGYANLGCVLVPRKRVAPPAAAEVAVDMPVMVSAPAPASITESSSPYLLPGTPDEAV